MYGDIVGHVLLGRGFTGTSENRPFWNKVTSSAYSTVVEQARHQEDKGCLTGELSSLRTLWYDLRKELLETAFTFDGSVMFSPGLN